MQRIVLKCPVCSGSGCSLPFAIRGYVYTRCKSCGVLYLDEKINIRGPAEEQYDSDYFKDSLKESMSGYMDYAKQSRPLRLNFQYLLSHIHRYLSGGFPKSLLDIGCAYGFFLDEARKSGFSVHGLDLSQSAINWMEGHLGIKGTVGYSFNAPQGPFDVITAIEVIEHASDPRSFLDDIGDRLKRGGILVIVTGACDTPAARVLGKRWWYLNPPDHCVIFSRDALRRLISDKGFRLLEHGLIPFHWVGLNNMALKVARILESKRFGKLAGSLPSFIIPVFHFSTQLLIAEKR